MAADVTGPPPAVAVPHRAHRIAAGARCGVRGEPASVLRRWVPAAMGMLLVERASQVAAAVLGPPGATSPGRVTRVLR